MKSKGFILFIIGLLAGGGAVYFLISFDTSLEIANLRSDILRGQSLNEQYNTLSDDYGQLLSQYNDLEASYEELLDQYEYVVANLPSSEDYEQLLSQYNDLEASYEELLEKYELVVASLPLSPEPISGLTIERTYTWTYEGRQWTLSLSIPESIYNYYQEKERISTRDYSVYVTHPYDDEYINTIIMKFNHIALEWGYSEEEKINLVISFVQSLPYTSDSVTTPYDEYPRYPLETLVDRGGDCEDTSILTASLLKSMHYDLVLIDLPSHMAVGINVDTFGTYYSFNDKKYFYLETTGEGWKIGDFPEDFKGKSAQLYELNPIPICTHSWTASYKGSKLEVVVTVNNEGTATANDIFVSVGFDAGEDMVWNRVESDSFDLSAGNSHIVTLLLTPPQNEHTRLIIWTVGPDGYYLDKSYSTWVDT